MLDYVKETFQYGRHCVTLEVGEIAKQADAAVVVTMGDTVVLVTCVAQKEVSGDRDFFPLTVNYQEKSYAAGRIPGSYFRREGRPSEQETLISRLIDRSLRPLFPRDFYHEVQIIATVMSLDPDVPADIPAIIGACAAITLSGIPFNGPIGAARVGYHEGELLLNPSHEQLKHSRLDLVVAGSEQAVLMVESEADILSEEVMLDAIIFGHRHMQVAIEAIMRLKQRAGKTGWQWQPPTVNQALQERLVEVIKTPLSEAYRIAKKLERHEKIATLQQQALTLFDSDDADKPSDKETLTAFATLEKDIVRQQVLDGNARIDGRDTRTVRPIAIRTGVLPRTHGCALFTRGETQAIVTLTLGSTRDVQIVDALEGEYKDYFLLHYNFPPYCVGETGMMTGPKRREVGHGRLAKRAMQAILPAQQDFPYMLRLVSEITESNGSSSMATVCGTSLALMDGGVPIKSPVAGIAMGLIKEDKRFAILTDILGDEDHLGDMDFKVAGTEQGITALQMDIKVDGINRQIMQSALAQARQGRLYILAEMNKVIAAARADISCFAPRVTTITIAQDKIREVIGKGGATIRGLCEEKGINSIDIDDDGVVSIFAVDATAALAVKKRIVALTTDIAIGNVYQATVDKIMDFGAVVNLLPGKTGFLHISQISDQRIENIYHYLSVGQVVKVKVVAIDRQQGRVRVSMKPSVFDEAPIS